MEALPIPQKLTLAALATVGATAQLQAIAQFPDGSEGVRL